LEVVAITVFIIVGRHCIKRPTIWSCVRMMNIR